MPELVKPDAFDVPFPMQCAVDEATRQAQMAACLTHHLPRLQQIPIREDDTVSIACYGPSLEDTWQDLKRPIISMSGALRFLVKRGIVPDIHVDMDPRVTKLPHLFHAPAETRYLLASVCHPFVWDLLSDRHVETFHVVSGANTFAWLQAHDPGSLLVVAGSSMGLGAIQIGGTLGYRHFEIHGMDGCFRGSSRHAGPHFGYPQKSIEWTANGRTWQTSKIMANSNVEMLNMLRQFPFFAVLHGTGLVQDMVEEADLPNAACARQEKAAAIRTASIEIVEECIGAP